MDEIVSANRPRTVLVLSAAVGDGHDAAAAAIEDALQRAWGTCETIRLHTLELVGPRFASACRSAFGFQLRAAPWAYDLSYDALRRLPPLARALKAGVGAFFAPSVGRAVDEFGPDLVVSTFPLASAALDRLRRTSRVRVPAATFVPDLAVHPFWVYPGVDLHFVLHEAPFVAGMPPGAVVVGAPMVGPRFGPGDRAAARAALGIPAGEFVALVTGGAWGAGSVERAVATLIGSTGASVLAACGRNAALLGRLRAAGHPPARLRPLGYVDAMPDLMAAADVVVTNGTGVTVLEAIRSARPLIAFEPLAGQGRAAAAVLRRMGIALVCEDPPALTRAVLGLVADPGRGAALVEAARSLAERRLDDDVARLEGLLVGA